MYNRECSIFDHVWMLVKMLVCLLSMLAAVTVLVPLPCTYNEYKHSRK